MAAVAVVFHSATGTTRELSKSIVSGILSVPGVRAIEIEIVGSDILNGRYRNQQNLDALDKVDAIIFGSPTFMGNVSAEFKAFADATSDKWIEKNLGEQDSWRFYSWVELQR
jgi:NAD(P)H dehydrogenase (quinone)